MCLLAVSLLTLSPLFSSSVSALDSSISVGNYTITYRSSKPNFRLSSIGQCLNGSYFASPSTFEDRSVSIFFGASCDTYFPFIPANSIIDVQFVTSGLSIESVNWTDANNAFLSLSVENQGIFSYWTLRLINSADISNAYILLKPVIYPTGNSSNASFGVESVVIYEPVSEANYGASLNYINGNISAVNNNLQGVISGVGGVQNSVNSAANQAHQDSQAQIDAINEQTQQEQDQYEQEKEEENQREDEMDGQASQAESMFSFTFLNPFIGLFELFNDSGCVAIPTIAGMVGSDQTTYCPWFDSSVRNILTPVFGLSSMILLFGFVIYWLRGDSSDILYKGGKR